MYILENEEVSQNTMQPIANKLQTAAKRLDCSVPYLRQKIKDGDLPVKRFGRSIRILERDLIAFAESNQA